VRNELEPLNEQRAKHFFHFGGRGDTVRFGFHVVVF
jgi:hypothetical protein